MDAVVSNPPYSLKWDPTGKDSDPRYVRYGIAPKSKADYAFLLHDLYHLKPNGIMTIVLPHGVLFRGGEEGNIRKNLIEQNNIDVIIGLPANIFFGTGIPTIVMVLRQKRENTDILIIDASKGFTKEGKNNKLRACDIRKIVDTIKERKNVEKYSKVVSLKDIRANDYNLNIPRYVDSSEAAESYDIYASMFGGIPEVELGKFDKYWEVFPSLKGELFTGEDYLSLKSENIRETIKNNKDVLQFIKNHMLRFGDLGAYLDSILIANATTINIPKTQEIIANNIFMRFVDTTLIDPYGAYEIFEDKFTEISGDLELIQTEGIKAVTQVDPNMVVKKKNGKDVEVQEGWKGHILPFDLVQDICLSERKRDLKEKQEKLAEIPSSYEEILESLSEDDKEIISEALNDTNDAFVFKNIKAVVKSLKADGESKELIESLEKVEKLNNEEKKLKTEIKQGEDELHLETKAKIESLSEEEVNNILHEKWSSPIYNGILDLSNNMLKAFTKDVEALSTKYAVTMDDLEKEIKETEKSLASMLSELTGSERDMEGINELIKLLGGIDE